MNDTRYTKYLKYLTIAEAVAGLSKDPSTKVGAVALDEGYGIVCMGYNGFPRGVHDTRERLENRDEKYPRTVHAESNVVAQAAKKGVSLEGTTLVVTFFPCSSCAALLIQAGIKTIISPPPDNERWQKSNELALEMLTEAGVEVVHTTKENNSYTIKPLP